jgi:hypothetical protein
LGKIAKPIAEPKNAKMSNTSEVNLKVQNIYLNPLLKPTNTCNTSCFEIETPAP